MRRVQFGFYLEEYNDFIPIAADGEKYQSGKKLNADYKYAYIRGKKLYVIEDENVHLKYSKKRNSFKTTFGRKQKQKFKPVSSYKVPKQ